jgi:hypothetical protein
MSIELTRMEDNDMTGSIYHASGMSQRPIRGECVEMPAPAQMFGNGKEEINAAGDVKVRKYGDRGGYKEEPGQFVI